MIQQFYWLFIKKKIKSLSHRDLYAHEHGSIIHNTQGIERTEVPTDEWMDKENMVYKTIEYNLNHKKEGNFAIYDNMGEWGGELC